MDGEGHVYVNSCNEPFSPRHNTEVFDRNNELVGAWYGGPIGRVPRFGPNGEVFSIGADGSILRLEVDLPGA